MKTTLALLSLLTALTVHAQLIVSFTGGDNLSVGPGTAAFEFTTGATPQTFRALGVYDSDLLSPGLYSSHSVGLWDASSHALLASVNVPAQGAVAFGAFWYANLAAPLTLAPNHTFVLGASYADSDFDFAVGNATVTVLAPGNTIGNARLSTGTGFEYPDLSVSGANLGFIGANALFTAVPEPSEISLIAGASLVIFAALRRTKLI